MKVVFLAACSALCVSSALASFDMMLMPNLSGRVNRYDPVNGVNLGGYNAGTPRVVTIDQANNRAFSWDSTSTRIRTYNYNTGESLGTAGNFATPTSLDYHAGSNRIFSLSTLGLFYTTPNTTNTFSFATLSAAVTWSTTAISGNTLTVFGQNGAGTIFYESFNCSTGASVGGGSSVTSILAASSFGKAAFFTSPNTPGGYYAFSFIDGFGGLRLARSTANVSGVAGVISSISLAGYASANVMPAAVAGHSGFFVVGQSSTTATDTLVRKYDNLPGFTSEYSNTISGTSFSAGSYKVANVVAPEPGSMIALGLGVAALVRKRRNQV
jgi:hypothetical protein